MEAWLAFIIMAGFAILTGIIALISGALKKGEE